MKASEIAQNTQMNAYIQQIPNTQKATVPQQGAAQGQEQGQAVQTQVVQRRDTVQLSPQSRMAREVVASNQVQQEERSQKVQALKEQVQNGTYQVNPIKVADAMMKDLIKNLG